MTDKRLAELMAEFDHLGISPKPRRKRRTKVQILVDGINDLLGKARKANSKLCAEIGIKDTGFCNDVVVQAPGKGNAVAMLVFDGDGFDSLSMESDVPYLMDDAGIDASGWDGTPLRKQIIALANKLGFDCEDYNSYSLGFYKR